MALASAKPLRHGRWCAVLMRYGTKIAQFIAILKTYGSTVTRFELNGRPYNPQ